MMARIPVFLTLAIFGLTFKIKAQSTDILFMEAAKKKLLNAKAYTLKVAELMPAEFYQFRPSEQEMHFAEQLLHLSANLGWLSSAYLTGGQNPVQKSDMTTFLKDSVIRVLNSTYDYALHALEYLPTNQLKEPVTFFAGPMNKLQIINLINDHQTHHRGQLLVYLRLKNIKPPDYVGW
jgi:uncharacterized damage-inducible protein DinB